MQAADLAERGVSYGGVFYALKQSEPLSGPKVGEMAPSPPQSQGDVLPCYTREQVAEHKKNKDCWVILYGEVYDVTRWLPKHPGGARILMHYAGEDATVSTPPQAWSDHLDG